MDIGSGRAALAYAHYAYLLGHFAASPDNCVERTVLITVRLAEDYVHTIPYFMLARLLPSNLYKSAMVKEVCTI